MYTIVQGTRTRDKFIVITLISSNQLISCQGNYFKGDCILVSLLYFLYFITVFMTLPFYFQILPFLEYELHQQLLNKLKVSSAMCLKFFLPTSSWIETSLDNHNVLIRPWVSFSLLLISVHRQMVFSVLMS